MVNRKNLTELLLISNSVSNNIGQKLLFWVIEVPICDFLPTYIFDHLFSPDCMKNVRKIMFSMVTMSRVLVKIDNQKHCCNNFFVIFGFQVPPHKSDYV